MKNVYFSFAALIAAAFLFTGCNQTKSKRLDDIVKDLSADSFSLSFEKTYPEYGITKTSYGAENFLVYADPEDVICGDRWRIRFPKKPVIIWGIPKIVLSTCPKYVPREIAELVKDIVTKADKNYSGIKEIRTFDRNKVLLGNNQFTSQFASLKPDMIDDSVLKGLDYNKFLLLEPASNLTSGFTRTFYGTADLTGFSTSANTDFAGIYKPILKGCYDPEILTLIRERLIGMNPDIFKDLQLTRSERDSRLAVLYKAQ